MRILEIYEAGEHRLPDDVAAAFKKLGELQRGAPEQAMLRVQRIMGGGVLSPLVEHVGDLTHRMTHLAGYAGYGYDMFADKAEKTLRWLNSPYGFTNEYKENVQSNANYRGVPAEELQSELDKALDDYAKAHAKLPVYNRLQWMARQAAIYVGEQNFSGAARCLEYLTSIAENPERYNEEASKFYRNGNGGLMQYRLGMEKKKPQNENVAITEVFDETYDWRWGYTSDYTAQAKFETDDGDEITVIFRNEGHGRNWDVTFERNARLHVTGTGDQFAILATVLDIIKEFVSQYDPPALSFSAEKFRGKTGDRAAPESGRTEAYVSMLKRFAHQHGYSFAVDYGHHNTFFELIRDQDQSS